MNVLGDVEVSTKEILRKKIRIFLTVLAISIGVSSVLILIGISGGLQNTIMDEFSRMGSNKIFIY